jgi:hypothetical protein
VIKAHTSDGQKVGEIQITQRLIEDDQQCFNLHYLVGLSLDMLGKTYLRQGIGSRMLELYRLHCVEDGEPFVAAIHDGEQREDGSHLTGDGLPFVDAMVESGRLDSGGSIADDHSNRLEESI